MQAFPINGYATTAPAMTKVSNIWAILGADNARATFPPPKGGYNQGGGGPQIQDGQYGQGPFGSPIIGHYGGHGQETFGTRGLGSQHYGVGALLLGGGNQHNWRVGWTHIHHPKIKDLMNQYLDCYNR
jgi:hypothetical protein